MLKILDQIKKHKWFTFLVSVGLFMLPLIIVHFLYKWQTKYYILQSDWFSGDLIMYTASFLAFAGSLLVSIIALANSEEANKVANRGNDISERLLVLENRQKKIELIPYVFLKSARYYSICTYPDMPRQLLAFFNLPTGSTVEGRYYNVKLEIINVSKICSYVHFIELSLQNAASEAYIFSAPLHHSNKNILLSPGESYDFDIFLPFDLLRQINQLNCFVSLDTTNHIKEVYRQFLFFKVQKAENDALDISLTNHEITPYENYGQTEA